MKTIPSVLLTHKTQNATTLCRLLLIGPLSDGTYRGLSSLDVNVVYDDGRGAVTYTARTGMEMSALAATSDLGVDNAEATSLLPTATHELEGITQAQVDAGALDKVPFVVYEINYSDLTPGRHEVIAGGTIGEQRLKNGQQTILELRSLSQQLKQTIGELDSLTCRAKFGSQPIGTGGGVVEERFPCGYNLAGEWVSGTVGAVGIETDRQFTDAGLTQAGAYFAPGVVEWLTGNNAGQKREVETFGLGGIVGLQFSCVSTILVGDTYRIRRECTKNKVGHNSCKDTFWLTNWALHYRGEPAIPVAETDKLSSPGAALSIHGTTGTGE